MSQILLGNLPSELSDEQVREFFSVPEGAPWVVTAVSIPSDPRTGKCRGYAFVDMATNEEAARAVHDLNGKCIGGRKISMSIVEAKQTKRKWYQFDSR